MSTKCCILLLAQSTVPVSCCLGVYLRTWLSCFSVTSLQACFVFNCELLCSIYHTSYACVCALTCTHTCTLAITHTHIFLWLCLPCISAVMYSKCALNYQCSSLKSVHIQTDLALTGSLAVFDCWFANICMIKTRCFMNTHSVYRNSNFSLLSAHRFP